MPLLMLPSFVTYSLATSLVPAISEANSQKNYQLIEYRLQQALRFAFLTGGLAVIVLYVLADPLMQLMYGSTKGSYLYSSYGSILFILLLSRSLAGSPTGIKSGEGSNDQ